MFGRDSHAAANVATTRKRAQKDSESPASISQLCTSTCCVVPARDPSIGPMTPSTLSENVGRGAQLLRSHGSSDFVACQPLLSKANTRAEAGSAAGRVSLRATVWAAETIHWRWAQASLPLVRWRPRTPESPTQVWFDDLPRSLSRVFGEWPSGFYLRSAQASATSSKAALAVHSGSGARYRQAISYRASAIRPAQTCHAHIVHMLLQKLPSVCVHEGRSGNAQLSFHTKCMRVARKSIRWIGRVALWLATPCRTLAAIFCALSLKQNL